MKQKKLSKNTLIKYIHYYFKYWDTGKSVHLKELRSLRYEIDTEIDSDGDAISDILAGVIKYCWYEDLGRKTSDICIDILKTLEIEVYDKNYTKILEEKNEIKGE